MVFCLCLCLIVCLFAPGHVLEIFLDVRSSLFLRVAFWNPCSGANFGFSCLVVACCFVVVFCLWFAFLFVLSLQDMFWKNSLDVSLLFFYGSLFGSIFGSELLFFLSCRGFFFLVVFCLCFLLYCCQFRSRKCCAFFFPALCFGNSP